MSGPEPQPKYTKYRARPALLRGAEGAADGPPSPRPRPQRGTAAPGGAPGAPAKHRRRRRRSPSAASPSGWRVARRRLARLLSLVLFLVSAQIQQGKVSDATERARSPAAACR